MSRKLMLASACLSVLCGDQDRLVAAGQSPTFKAGVEYVEIGAVVTDRQSRPVRDLRKEDFQIFDSGRPQRISSFAFVDLPLETYDRHGSYAHAIEPDVTTNKRPFDGRMYVAVIDDLHIDASRSQLVTRGLKDFIEKHLHANDIMAVVHTSGPKEASQEFTSNRRLLLAAVDRTTGRKIQSETVARNELYARTKDIIKPDPNGASGVPLDQVFDPNDVERAQQAKVTLSFLEKVTNWYRNVHGRRKSILFISEGIDYDILDVMGNGAVPNNRSSNAHAASAVITESIRDVIGAATRADVNIYGVDPRSLVTASDAAIGSLADIDTLNGRLEIGVDSLMKEAQRSQESLRALSEETGGFAIVNQNQLATAYQRIVNDNSLYYEIGYSIPSGKRDGQYHRIDVRVNRPGLTVRARRGWMAPKGKLPVQPAGGDSRIVALHDAANSPAPMSMLRMQMFAAAFKAGLPNASVLIGAELFGRDMKLTPGDQLKVLYVAVDARDKVQSHSTTVALNFRPETKALVEQSAVRIIGRLNLPPGRYQIRYAVHESSADVIGSVRYDLEIPDFTKLPLSMSGILLTSPVGSLIPTIQTGDDAFQRALPGLPIAGRVFSQDDEIGLLVEVYDNERSKPHKVDIVTTMTDAAGTIRFKTGEMRDSVDLHGESGYRYMTRVPLGKLAPGEYVLRVAARADLESEPAADRQIPLTIVSSEAAAGAP